MANTDTLIQIDHYKNEQLIRLVSIDTHLIALNDPARPSVNAAADAATADELGTTKLVESAVNAA